MSKLLLALTTLLYCTHIHSDISLQSVKNALYDIGVKGGQAVTSAKDTLMTIGHKANATVDALKYVFTEDKKPKFCPLRPVIYAPTIDDSAVTKHDTENLIPIIKKYSPILYLCNERYYPMAVEDCFTAPTTQLVREPNYKTGGKAPKSIIIPAGQVTMEKIYENGKQYPGEDTYFEIGECTKFGSNPARFSDGRGNLTTPAYVACSKHNNKIYIVYAFFYAFNGAYPVTMPMEGAHDFDLEHITLELNENKELERIFFATHSSAEGVWLPAHHKDIQYEGTHPIVYVAQTGHGCYPREGAHVRIYGFGNDYTGKTKKWIPQLVLLYPENDPRFDPKTMGWAYHSGDYARFSVGSFKRFFDAQSDRHRGQPYESVQFCPNPPQGSNNPLDWIEYQACIESKRPAAKIPEKKLMPTPESEPGK